MEKYIKNIERKNSFYRSYNHTVSARKTIYFPKNIQELKKIISLLKLKQGKVLIKTGNCGHGDKTKLSSSDYVISLSKINKIKKIDKKNNTVDIEAGANLLKIFKFLEKKKYKIFNVPGGNTVSLGGAIAGNVHGRPSAPGYSVFGDNIVSLKILNESGKVIQLKRSNDLFYKVVGGLSLFGIIIEAKIKIFKLENINYNFEHTHIFNTKSFKNFDKKNKIFYGYLNFFNKYSLEGNFMTLNKKKKNIKNNFEKKKSDTLFKLINLFKIDILVSPFINSFTLKIFYYVLFKFSRFFLSGKIEVIDHERNTYFVNINTYLPYYFTHGMTEIQFSVPKKNIIKTIREIKNLQFNSNIFPYFFLVKKMQISKGKYIFNFPKYNHCISLGFSKKPNRSYDLFLSSLYKILHKNNGNLYITKDETFLDYNPKKKFIKFYRNHMLKNKIFSSNFKEKFVKIKV